MRISWREFEERFERNDGWRDVVDDARWTPGRELEAVARLAFASKAKRAVEIGTANGHTTVALARTLPDAEIITFGTTRELAGHNDSEFDREIFPKEKQGAYIRQQSPEIQKRITAVVGKPRPRQSLLDFYGKIRFAYIDGDHRWEAVAEDTKAVLRKCYDDAIIVWDDYGFHYEVREFINVLNRRAGDLICEVERTRIVFVQLDAEKLKVLRAAAELL